MRFERGFPLRESKVYTPFRATEIWNAIVNHLKSNVEVKRRRHIMRYYNNCFTGCSAVETIYQYLVNDKETFSVNISRDNAIKVCQTMLDKKVFEPVPPPTRQSYGNTYKKPVFEDSASKLYRFSPISNVPVPSTVSTCPNCSMSSLDDSDGENDHSMETAPVPRRKSMDPSIICNPEEPSPRPTIMRVRSTGSIQLCQNTPLVKHPMKAPMQVQEDVLKQVALCELLRILDVPIIDGFLSHLYRDSSPRAFGWTNFGATFNTCTSPMFGKKAHDAFLTAAMDCIATSSQDLPGLRREGFCVPLSVDEKRHLFEMVLNVHTNLEKTLLSEWDVDFHLAICNMILHGKEEKAKLAFHLYSLVLAQYHKDKLIRLFKFIQFVVSDEQLQQCSQMYSSHCVLQVFTDSILRHPLLAHELAVIVVSFFFDNQALLTKSPPKYLQDEIDRILVEIQSGTLVPYQPPRFSQALSVSDYELQTSQSTASSLVQMMNSLIDDVKLSLKDKKHKLKQFQKHHPQLYKKYFSNMV
ncbi:unnamed protein product [Acanthosepion pharaonis]|uniref:DEP domain-containing protein n=1 Tax=Acanthosepion pharaonis TaxID=158019 RepID=A0A812EIC8_ACAPH|nr:unnamed protein product [Sepia pharaonis]